MRLALAFFGLPRCTRMTIDSIRQNLVAPLAAHGELQVFYHFMQQSHVRNTRSREDEPLSADNYEPFLEFSGRAQAPQACIDARLFAYLCRFGDAWDDGFQSLRNLLLQLHSLDAVTSMVEPFEPDAVVFARPDLIYHDALDPDDVDRAAGSPLELVVPAWQWWGGYNDRFAICGSKAYGLYGHRLKFVIPYCRKLAEPLHGERLLRAVAIHAGLQASGMPLRASRVRVNGTMTAEDFSPPREPSRAGR